MAIKAMVMLTRSNKDEEEAGGRSFDVSMYKGNGL
jgi:hypothetical protein